MARKISLYLESNDWYSNTWLWNSSITISYLFNIDIFVWIHKYHNLRWMILISTYLTFFQTYGFQISWIQFLRFILFIAKWTKNEWDFRMRILMENIEWSVRDKIYVSVHHWLLFGWFNLICKNPIESKWTLITVYIYNIKWCERNRACYIIFIVRL